MVNTRKQVAVHRYTVKSLRSRHFSTTHQTPRFAFTPTQIELRNPDPALKPKRRPLVEAHFSDEARQPFIHDFRVKVKHGRKVSNFCVFLKRGKTLDLNPHGNGIVGDVVLMRVSKADPDMLVNMRSTDKKIADFVFAQSQLRICRFQEPQRTRLPKELVVEHDRAFPGLA
ncbi:hypothetical protein C8F04DRAFT_1183706 [Mycena alexandri]|uniref:Uncharacterized protein n=1 Tax=Mycena alexandri TaxID=1745969 RepID=A0AAD6X287_9AGAR|nr:hypothetical protein C8F04DRAFT_1183706 [Mycena alexandri]